jgi:hypothetical protein
LNQEVVQSIPHPPRASGVFFCSLSGGGDCTHLSQLTVSPLLRYAFAMRSKSSSILIFIVFLASSFLAAQRPTAAPVVTEANNPASSKNVLLVSAPPHDPLTLSLADLKALPHITVTIHNPHTNADETYSGVRLANLLEKLEAPLGNALRGEALGKYIIATGSDGYRAVLAFVEVDPTFHPGEVIVADTMNDKPLDEHSGPLKLVVTEDNRPARSVRNLASIELKSLP